MTEEGHDNLPQGGETENIEDEFVPADALPICPKCLSCCHPLQYYCHNCDSNEVINPLASYMPFVRIRFNVGMFGKLWRKIWRNQNTPIIVKLIFTILTIIAVLAYLS